MRLGKKSHKIKSLQNCISYNFYEVTFWSKMPPFATNGQFFWVPFWIMPKIGILQLSFVAKGCVLGKKSHKIKSLQNCISYNFYEVTSWSKLPTFATNGQFFGDHSEKCPIGILQRSFVAKGYILKKKS